MMRSTPSNEKTNRCKVCLKPIDDSLTSFVFKDMQICHRCYSRFNPKLKHFTINGVRGCYLYEYDDYVKEKLYQLKGCYDYELSPAFLDYFRRILHLKYRGFTLIPAPSSKSADEKRGFNHVVEIFRTLELPMLCCVHKIADVKQADLTFKQRQQIGKHLVIEDVDLKGKKILIVDDVLTTGATIKAMIELVKSKNPKKIEVFTMSKKMKGK